MGHVPRTGHELGTGHVVWKRWRAQRKVKVKETSEAHKSVVFLHESD